MIKILKNHVVQTVGVLAIRIVILLNCCPRGFGQTESSTEREAKLTALLLAPSIPYAQALGNESAEITLVEFGDYQCTFCKRFHAITRELVINNFVDTGKIRFLKVIQSMTYRLQTPQPSLLKHLTVQQTNIDIGNITMSCMITGEERIQGG